jgi:hypothetical protein
MNDRILELAKLAGLKKAHGSDREYIGDFDWRQFADLIVRDCAEICLEANDHNNILRYFGVEE